MVQLWYKHVYRRMWFLNSEIIISLEILKKACNKYMKKMHVCMKFWEYGHLKCIYELRIYHRDFLETPMLPRYSPLSTERHSHLWYCRRQDFITYDPLSLWSPGTCDSGSKEMCRKSMCYAAGHIKTSQAAVCDYSASMWIDLLTLDLSNTSLLG